MNFPPDFLTELFRDPLDPSYAEAARNRRPTPGWLRGAHRGVTWLTLLAIGFLFAAAYRQVVVDEPETARTRAGLLDEVRSRQAGTDLLQERADRLRADVARQRDALLAGDQAAALRNLEAAAGLAAVTGDGVVVRVANAPQAVDPVTGQANGDNLGQVYDRDLQDLVNGLWQAGAEAVAVNGQRLTAISTIRAAGSAILVDFKPVSSPYEITAIGPGNLAKAFGDSSTGRRFRSYQTAYGMAFDVRDRDGLTLPAASDPQLRYAHPKPGDTPSPSIATPDPPSPSTSPGGR